MKRASDALARFTVIDLTRARSGPTCARQLADWGADVIKVEMPVDADNPPQDFANRNDPDFQNLHRNKRSITLNLKSPDGLAVLHKLVERADVLIENYRPDVKDRLGFSYDDLKKINPRLVYTSISGFGQDGPYRERPGLDQVAQGMGGLMSVTGAPGDGPMRVGIAIADSTSGLLGAYGTLVALLERDASGEGQWVQTSLLEAQIFMLDFQAARWLINRDLPGQEGNHHPTAAPMGCFKCRDGYINVAPMPGAWGKFCQAMGLDHLIDDPDYATPGKRRKNRKAVNRIVEAALLKKDRATWIEELNHAGIPCGPVNTIEETFADPQVQHLGIAETIESDTLGPITLNGQPITLSRTDSAIQSATPALGQHTDEVLDWLGYTPDDIANLQKSGAI